MSRKCEHMEGKKSWPKAGPSDFYCELWKRLLYALSHISLGICKSDCIFGFQGPELWPGGASPLLPLQSFVLWGNVSQWVFSFFSLLQKQNWLPRHIRWFFITFSFSCTKLLQLKDFGRVETSCSRCCEAKWSKLIACWCASHARGVTLKSTWSIKGLGCSFTKNAKCTVDGSRGKIVCWSILSRSIEPSSWIYASVQTTKTHDIIVYIILAAGLGSSTATFPEGCQVTCCASVVVLEN